jgi:hypothetical protein
MKELDIFIPDLNLAFECNGLYWHSTIFKPKSYHFDKLKLCQDNNIRLITIWEDDWNFKQDIIKSMIKNLLSKNDNKIYARKTQIKIVNSNEKTLFLEQNHLQGNCQSSINLGLYYDNELVSLMTFGKKRMIMKGITENNSYELLRFCNKLGINVTGGASKLFKYFLDNYNVCSVISYANCDISNGHLYETLGFDLIGHTGINYWWAKDGIKYHRSNFMKHKLVKEGADPNKTENEIMHERGYTKIYGTGNLKYEWPYNIAKNTFFQ